MHARAPRPDNRDAAATPALSWPSVAAALLAGVGAVVLVSWVGTHLVS